MKMYCFLVLLLCLFCSSTNTLFTTNCPTDPILLPLKIPHQFDCSLFYICNGSVQPSLLGRCPNDLQFNASTQNCSSPTSCSPKVVATVIKDEVDEDLCPENNEAAYSVMVAVPDSCWRFYGCKHNKTTLFQCPHGLHFSVVTESCELPSVANCDKCQNYKMPHCPTNPSCAVMLPHPTNCSQYYACTWGRPILKSCPGKLLFNPDSEVCDWPNNVECNRCPDNKIIDDSPPRCNQENDKLPHELDCSKYYQCVNKTPQLRECENGYFNSYDGKCENDHNSKCGRICENGSRIENKFDINSYFVCFDGELMKVRCPMNYWFNDVVKKCEPMDEEYKNHFTIKEPAECKYL